jgi:hypothetical protein
MEEKKLTCATSRMQEREQRMLDSMREVVILLTIAVVMIFVLFVLLLLNK